MNSQLVFKILLVVIILIFTTPVDGASDPKSLELNRKLSEISALQHGLSDRIAVAVKMRDQFQKQVDELTNEILRIRDNRELKSYQAAVKHPRIRYNIKLIHQLAVYTHRLNKRMTYFESGNETLTFLHQQVVDDLQLIRTLNDMEVDELINKINTVLDEYFPETKKNIITVENIQASNPEKIWIEIMTQKLE
jgi:phenylalanyl-tRNA synthetase alpha subunit